MKNNELLSAKCIITMLIIFSSSCSLSPIAPNPVVDEPTYPGVVSSNPDTNFINSLKLQGVNLTSDEKKMVQDLQNTKAIGRWETSDGSTPKDNLEQSFNTFGKTFQPNGPQDSNAYMVKAIQFANSINYYSKYYFDTEYYKQKQKVLLIKWDPQTKEFIIIHLDGRVSNYQITENIKEPRYIVVPDGFSSK